MLHHQSINYAVGILYCIARDSSHSIAVPKRAVQPSSTAYAMPRTVSIATILVHVHAGCVHDSTIACHRVSILHDFDKILPLWPRTFRLLIHSRDTLCSALYLS